MISFNINNNILNEIENLVSNTEEFSIEDYQYLCYTIKNKLNKQKHMNNNVTISERELRIMYNVDNLSTAQIASNLNVDIRQVKSALKMLGIPVRRNEPEFTTNTPTLYVTRLDGTTVDYTGQAYTSETVTPTTNEAANVDYPLVNLVQATAQA